MYCLVALYTERTSKYYVYSEVCGDEKNENVTDAMGRKNRQFTVESQPKSLADGFSSVKKQNEKKK